MTRKGYIPRGDTEIAEFAKNLYNYTLSRHAGWSVPHPKDWIKIPLDEYECCLGKMQNPNRGRIDIQNKNERKMNLEKALRTYIQGFIARNPLVNNEHRAQMNLPVSSANYSSIGIPTDQVEADLAFPGIHLVELVNIRTVGKPGGDPRADYGVRIHYGIIDAVNNKYRISEQPKTGDDLPYSVFTRRKKFRFDFDGERGKAICFCLRYENSKGQAGPFSAIIEAIVP